VVLLSQFIISLKGIFYLGESLKKSSATAQFSPVSNVQPVLLWPNIGPATWDKGCTFVKQKKGKVCGITIILKRSSSFRIVKNSLKKKPNAVASGDIGKRSQYAFGCMHSCH